MLTRQGDKLSERRKPVSYIYNALSCRRVILSSYQLVILSLLHALPRCDIPGDRRQRVGLGAAHVERDEREAQALDQRQRRQLLSPELLLAQVGALARDRVERGHRLADRAVGVAETPAGKVVAGPIVVRARHGRAAPQQQPARLGAGDPAKQGHVELALEQRA